MNSFRKHTILLALLTATSLSACEHPHASYIQVRRRTNHSSFFWDEATGHIGGRDRAGDVRFVDPEHGQVIVVPDDAQPLHVHGGVVSTAYIQKKFGIALRFDDLELFNAHDIALYDPNSGFVPGQVVILNGETHLGGWLVTLPGASLVVQSRHRPYYLPGGAGGNAQDFLSMPLGQPMGIAGQWKDSLLKMGVVGFEFDCFTQPCVEPADNDGTVQFHFSGKLTDRTSVKFSLQYSVARAVDDSRGGTLDCQVQNEHTHVDVAPGAISAAQSTLQKVGIAPSDCLFTPNAHAEMASSANAATSPTTPKKVERIRGWGDAMVTAFSFPGSGACAVEGTGPKSARAYTVESAGTQAPSATKIPIHIDAVGCDALEDDHLALSAVLVRVESEKAIDLPLEGLAATLRNQRGQTIKSIALFVPLDPSSEDPWMKATDEATLVLELEPKNVTDLWFVFEGEKSKSNDQLVLAGREIPWSNGASPCNIETRRDWTLHEPRMLESRTDAKGREISTAELLGTRKCSTEASLSMSGRELSMKAGSALDIVANTPSVFCPGAKHTWVGRSRDVLGVLPAIGSSKSDPLRFEVTRDGYRYLGGRGFVALGSGHVLHFRGHRSKLP